MQEDIKKSIEVLRSGGVILYPTDTIWGLGCDATNQEAVKKIYDIKKRSDSKSLIVLMDSENKLNRYVNNVPDIVYDLIELSESPLTIILEDVKFFAENIINKQDDSVGIRITNEKFSNSLIRQFKKPIVSTSANISGLKSPLLFDDISQDIINSVDYVVQYRQDDTKKSAPSKIIKVDKQSRVKIIRQ
jgi:L-threonylcarbamoyladenylate synthase